MHGTRHHSRMGQRMQPCATYNVSWPHRQLRTNRAYQFKSKGLVTDGHHGTRSCSVYADSSIYIRDRITHCTPSARPVPASMSGSRSHGMGSTLFDSFNYRVYGPDVNQ